MRRMALKINRFTLKGWKRKKGSLSRSARPERSAGLIVVCFRKKTRSSTNWVFELETKLRVSFALSQMKKIVILVWMFSLVGVTCDERDPWALSGDLFETETLESLTVKLDEGAKVELTVKVATYPDESHSNFKKVTRKADDGVEYETHLYQGKELEPYQYPGGTYVIGFDLRWDGNEIVIPKMFWNDLYGVYAQKLKLLRKPTSEEEQFAMQTVDDTLYRPRLSLSSSKGTLLINWKRPEE